MVLHMRGAGAATPPYAPAVAVWWTRPTFAPRTRSGVKGTRPSGTPDARGETGRASAPQLGYLEPGYCWGVWGLTEVNNPDAPILCLYVHSYP